VICTRFYVVIVLVLLLFSSCAVVRTYNAHDFGLKPQNGYNNSPHISKAIHQISLSIRKNQKTILNFEPGIYEFTMEGAVVRSYYISNHDQINPKTIGFDVENIENFTINGNGASFIFHGSMLPIAVTNCKDIELKNFAVDFVNPHIAQVKILENDTTNKMIIYEPADWVKYRIDSNRLVVYGDHWEHTPVRGIGFEEKTRRIIFNTGDIALGTKNIAEIEPGVIKAPWDDPKLIPGSVVAMRGSGRPAPGIFLEKCVDTRLKNITVHYAEGMGLLAQNCDHVLLDGFKVALKGNDDPRYYTTQADATHFSGCKGLIEIKNGLFENMMDDAINVHGTYLKIMEKLNNRTVKARYMHHQSWGFEWGYPGDTVQFLRASTLDNIGLPNCIYTIQPLDTQTFFGVREFEIIFTDTLDPVIRKEGNFGIENLSWTPHVIFSHNIIRNNRARGALFSTPRKTLVENNVFDHTSGSAILLCGDCNGWYETGACRDVVIRNNQFIHALTSMYQFTNAIISIYPEIPDMQHQRGFFHGAAGLGVQILNNYFEISDKPIVYAKSLSDLIFSGNKVVLSGTYKPFHWNQKSFLLEKVGNFSFENNDFDVSFSQEKDVLWMKTVD